MSPYQFTDNNPINLIDPDGRHVELPILDENHENYNEENAEAQLRRIETIIHESFIHVEYFTTDILDDGIINYSNMPENIVNSNYKNQVHHAYEDRRARLGLPTRFNTKGFSALLHLNEKLELGLSRTEVWNLMW